MPHQRHAEADFRKSPDRSQHRKKNHDRDIAIDRAGTAELIFSDDSVVVVNKPAGMRLGPDADEPESLLNSLGLADVAAAYPLDDDASGIVIAGRTAAAQQALAAQRNDGDLRITFLAIVRAARPADAGTIELPLAAVGDRYSRVRVDEKQGRPAKTEWRLRDAYIGYALLECTPVTDLRQQVRAHLAAVGMPPVVDPLYGGASELLLSSFKAGYRPSRRHDERPLIKRLTLHAERVEFRHPASGEPMAYSTQPPRDFRAAVYQLGKYGRLPPPHGPRQE